MPPWSAKDMPTSSRLASPLSSRNLPPVRLGMMHCGDHMWGIGARTDPVVKPRWWAFNVLILLHSSNPSPAALVMYQPHDPFVFLSDAFEHIAAVSSAKEAAMDRHISSPCLSFFFFFFFFFFLQCSFEFFFFHFFFIFLILFVPHVCVLLPAVRRSVGSRIGGGSDSGTVQPGLLTDFATAYFEEDRVGTAQRSGRVSALLPARCGDCLCSCAC